MSDKGTESRSESLHEKIAAVSQEEAPVKEKDLAYGGEDTLPPPPTLTAEEEKRLWRKIDMKLMPILTLMYLCSFLDRGNIGACASTLVKGAATAERTRRECEAARFDDATKPYR